jgi:hypothetical protein
MANLEGLTKTWSVGDSSNREQSTHYSTSATSLIMKASPGNAILREYTSAMAESDKLLAKVFGGPGAVAAGNGFEPAGLAAGYPFYRGDITGDDGRVRRGHLSYAMHLYGSADGSGESPLYVPAAFTSHSAQPSPTDGVVTFYYPRLGNLSDVTLAVFHVADSRTKVAVFGSEVLEAPEALQLSTNTRTLNSIAATRVCRRCPHARGCASIRQAFSRLRLLLLKARPIYQSVYERKGALADEKGRALVAGAAANEVSPTSGRNMSLQYRGRSRGYQNRQAHTRSPHQREAF